MLILIRNGMLICFNYIDGSIICANRVSDEISIMYAKIHSLCTLHMLYNASFYYVTLFYIELLCLLCIFLYFLHFISRILTFLNEYSLSVVDLPVGL